MMNPTVQKILIVTTCMGIGAVGTFGVNWLVHASESHETTATEEVEQTEMGKVVKSNAELLKKLAEGELERAAAKKHTLKLCKAGTITSCRVCAEAGYYEAEDCK